MSLAVTKHFDRQLRLGNTSNPLDHLRAYEAATRDRGAPADIDGLHKATHSPGTGHDMLVLARKEREIITIGDDINIEVTQIKGRKVSLAITAPASVPIVRGELLPSTKAAVYSHEAKTLTLSRTPNESIHIGDNIIITVLEPKNSNQTRLGIEAPRNIPVHREEVRDRIVAEHLRELNEERNRNSYRKVK